METHMYNVSAIKAGDKAYVSKDDLKTILDLENIQVYKEILSFKDLVFKIWSDCILKGSYPWNNPKAITVQTKNMTCYYDSEKINKNQRWILLYLNQLHLSNQGYLVDGTKWTELKQPIEFLISMGDAVVQSLQENNQIKR